MKSAFPIIRPILFLTLAIFISNANRSLAQTSVPTPMPMPSMTPFAFEKPQTAQAAQDAFHPGEVWKDTSGVPIQAHGGGILKVGMTYYWYGEDKTKGNGNKTGISCYSSTDLLHWKHEGTALPKALMPPEFRDNGIVERPKVIYCALTRKYVMWMHLDNGGYSTASAGVAVSDSPTGPFRFLKKFRPAKFPEAKDDACHQKELGGTFRDMGLFVDDDQKAYVVYASDNNATTFIVRLDNTYTDAEQPSVEGKTWVRVDVHKFREAPVIFKYQSKYYLFTSGQSGWAPNAAGIQTASNIFGPWSQIVNPCIGAKSGTTFDSQSTFVLPAPGKPPGNFIYMGDRWKPKELQDSRYVWLPFHIKPDGAFHIQWMPTWNMSWFDSPTY